MKQKRSTLKKKKRIFPSHHDCDSLAKYHTQKLQLSYAKVKSKQIAGKTKMLYNSENNEMLTVINCHKLNNIKWMNCNRNKKGEFILSIVFQPNIPEHSHSYLII